MTGFRAHLLRQESGAIVLGGAFAALSSTENSQMPTKPIVIENSAGDV
jgi:hypothetical protein